MRRWISLALSLALLVTLVSCGASSPEERTVELQVFAASSLTEALDEILAAWEEEHPSLPVTPTYDSSGTLLTQIREGAPCDLFLSAAPRQMDELELAGLLEEGTRLDLLENRVVLAVPPGNPKDIRSLDELALALREGDVFLAVGNSDVPVGQYTQKIFRYYGLEEEQLAAAGLLTYGSNVKEVTTQVREAAADCGIIYATDARSAGLTAVDTATEEMCGKVICPAAVLTSSPHLREAEELLAFLCAAPATEIFRRVGFTPLT